MFKNILLTIAYDGTPYRGWQRQPNADTVQGTVEKALSGICRRPVVIDGTSRTDAGVHAYGQRATFSGDIGIPTDRICYAANNILPGSIRLTDAREVPADLHARFSAKGKTYIYKIITTDTQDPFMSNYYYFVNGHLDEEAMRRAAGRIVGRHDFKCFQASNGEERRTTVRTVSGIEISRKDIVTVLGAKAEEIDISVTGDGFLYNMVRIITGTLIEAGLGKTDPDDVRYIIESRDRSLAGHTAPPQGLYLKEIFY